MIRKLLSLFLLTSSLFSFSQSRDSLDIMIGQMILIGIGDFNFLTKTEPIYWEIEHGNVGGIILFEKNLSLESPDQRLTDIIKYAQEKAQIPLFVSIDEEGGRVNRLKPRYGFPQTVSAQYLGELDNLDSTYFYASKTAKTLDGLGINMNFAPSVDVNVNPINPIIGKIGRSYSGNPYKVAAHASEVVRAHDASGVTTVLKHFPGHGSSAADTHLGIADVSTTWRFEELYPYKLMMNSGNVRAIMTAHIVNEKLDERKLPATLSYKVVTEMLREFMGYQGVVVSDDMQMKAISKEYGMHDALRMSLNAGVDIMLFANNVPDYDVITASELHAHIRDLVETREVPESRIRESYQRIMKLKKEMGLLD